MSDDRKDLPPAGAPNFNERLRETLQTYLGMRGDKLDRGVTLRDLSEANIVALSKGFLAGVGGRGSPIAGAGAAVTGAYEPDLTPPPTPEGFTASAAISNLLIECAAQTYLQGHGHARTVVYGATWVSGPLPTFASAVKITEFTGTVFSYPTNPATTWRLWIKWQSVDGVESGSPAGGTNGVEATTGQDVGKLLAALTGQITSSQLYSALGARIDLIDGATGLATKASITQVATAKSEAIAASAAVTDTISARLNTGDFAAVQVQSSANASSVTGFNAQWTVKTDVAGLVSGFGLASTASNAAPSSAFGVRASNFYVAPASVAQTTAPTADLYDGYVWLDTSVAPNVTRYRSGASWVLNSPVLPFVVQATPTTVNGVAVPAGVYASDLYVKNGTITNAKIGNLAVDDAKISSLSVAKLTAGSIAVGQYIQSTSYVANTNGWRINGDGTAELGAAYIRGQLTAAQIDTRGLSIKDGAGNIILAAGTALTAANITPAAGWLNSNVSLGGLGYTGATNATYGADWSTNVTGAAAVNSSITTAGTTAAWSGVSGTGRPADNATVGATSANLTVGVGGNMIPNSDLSSGADKWVAGWSQNGSGYVQPALDYAGSDWTPTGGHQVGATRSGTTPSTTGVYDIWDPVLITVVPGKRYEFSAYMAAHRCTASMGIVGYNAALDTQVSWADSTPCNTTGGQLLSGWTRVTGFFTATANTACVRVYLRGSATSSNDPYHWGTRLFFAEAGPNQTEFSPWSDGGRTGKLSEQSTVALGNNVTFPDGSVIQQGDLISRLQKIGMGNVSTFIESGAIGQAYIGNLDAGKITTGTLSAGTIDVTKLTGSSQVYDPGDYWYTVPAGMYSLAFTVKGGGGAGGGGGTGGMYIYADDTYGGKSGGSGGMGGNGGRYRAVVGVTPGQSIFIHVGGPSVGGAGGSGGAAGAAGASGNNSYVTVAGSTFYGNPGSGGGGGGAAYIQNVGGVGSRGFRGAAGAWGTAGAGGGSITASGTGSSPGFGGAGGFGTTQSGAPGTNGTNGGAGEVLIEAYQTNGLISRSEWENLMTHMNQRLTGFTWP